MGVLSYLGILVFILFYGSYLSKQLLLKQQGITSDRLGRGDKPKRTLIIEKLLKTATFSMAGVQLFSLFIDRRFHLLNWSKGLQYTWIFISFMGVVVFITAMVTMKSSWRAGVDTSQHTKLVRKGIYRISRNPAFLGFDLFYLGFTLAFSNPLQIVLTVFCITMLHLQISEEEKFLPEVFGKDYLDYKKSVGRYFLFF
jgi:protein-S-isoprenylcysteine O-methyltransferase Ste14